MPIDTFADHYETLQVSPVADPEIIEAAYRRLARKNHPDVNKDPNAHARMSAINQAYAVLKDPAKRSRYDAERAYARRKPPHASHNPTPNAKSSKPKRPKPPKPPRPPKRPNYARKHAKYTYVNVDSEPTRQRSNVNAGRARHAPPTTLGNLPYARALPRAVIACAMSGAIAFILPLAVSEAGLRASYAIWLLIATNAALCICLATTAAIAPFHLPARFGQKLSMLTLNLALIGAATFAIAAQTVYLMEIGADPIRIMTAGASLAGFGIGYVTRLYQPYR